MIFVFIGLLISFSILYFLSRGKYDGYIKSLDKREYPLKSLIPIGLFIMDAIKYKYSTKYDRNIYIKLSELYGIKNARYYLRIYWGKKILYLIMALLIVLLFSLGMEKINFGFIFISIAILGAVSYGTDRELNEKLRKRYRRIRIDFPDFINKLTFLVDAGMTIQRAWEKIVIDNEGDRPLYDELHRVWLDIKGGKSQTEAYEDFARRCRTPEISKFISVILQNLRKGNAQLVTILRVQGSECWEMRKNEAKKLGEEASSKLVFPMMIMFIAILIIVLTPAVLQLKGM
ncbi:type II secretion system F family protein [Paramaledivibacter caminithermalis]|jgi:tight adherence protein C|uniref:Tight adherence protein C n=1 Tax=Paramaledivibacter caminithermalis (strain DSM 15212 / CIP 107654 / DViRD3) TaxID=1121301 RepID=A0A1M6PHS8_PARC5|nr:type II secretion system F family protein [Paramaledivibacter caminithermalis]SHK07482.1 tight adherence protein C [Paramaledivibacter caminithermalis DSM 15212]